jgi:glycosyltransferase involved in cell wall biosynthesis
VKLLLYSNYFAPSVGGVETIVRSLARGLTRLRVEGGRPEFEVTVVTQTSRGSFDEAALPFPVIRMPGLAGLFRLIRECDVLHVAGPSLAPLILGKILRKPIVLEHHGFQTICPNGQLLIEPQGEPCPGHFMAGRHSLCLKCNAGRGASASLKLWLLTFVRRFLAKRVKANVMPTQWLGELLQLPSKEWIPHGLEPREELPVPRKAEAAFARIVFQGRLVSTKGVKTLLEAVELLLKEHCQFDLRIIGDGPERARMEAVAARAPFDGKVTFTGQLGRQDLERELAGADIVALPSVGGEVFGLAVAENMQRGLPVVASDLGAFVEVIGDGGMVFRTGDAKELARCLKELISDTKQREKLGMAARRRAESIFSLERMIGGHAALYKRIV